MKSKIETREVTSVCHQIIHSHLDHRMSKIYDLTKILMELLSFTSDKVSR